MKKKLVLLSLLLVSGILLNSCEDKYTEKDAMESLQKITLHVSVLDASGTDLGIAGAIVTVVDGTTTLVDSTNEVGVAIFEDFKISENVRVTVTKDAFTTVSTNIDANPDYYRETVVNSNVYLYATAGDNIATVKGELTAELDLTNREREMLEGIEVIAYNSSLNGTKQYYTGTTDAEGKYSIPVPIDGNGGNEVYVYFPTIEKDRTVGRSINNRYFLETTKGIYSASNYGETAVERVPSTFIDIAAPPSSGSGFQLGLKAVRNALSSSVNNEFYDAAIVSGGTGYTGTENFVFAADPNGNRAELNVAVNGDGVITNVNFIDNGATYSSMPAIVTSPATGSGASFDFRYRYLYRVFISNYGSGYVTFPTVGVEYTSTLDNTSKLKKEFGPNMDDSNPLGGGDLYNNAFITGGSIKVENSSQGDTLFTTGYVYSLPVFTYSGEDRLQAAWFASINAVSLTDSSLADNFSYYTQGVGYDYSNPPAVAVTALAGYGSGAVVKAEVNSAGNLTDLVVMVKGSGYTQDINDYDGDGNFQEEEDADLIGFSTWSTGYGRHDNVKPGMTYMGNVFYGTGMEKK